jgi:hypothetical protein
MRSLNLKISSPINGLPIRLNGSSHHGKYRFLIFAGLIFFQQFSEYANGGSDPGTQDDEDTSYIQESVKQEAANKRITDKIRQIYQKARKQPGNVNPSVCDDVILAVRMGAIGTGMRIRDLENIFGEKSLIWGKKKAGGAVAVIPLDFPLLAAKEEHEPFDPGPRTAQSGQMYLFVRASKDMDIEDLYFRYGAVSGFLAKDLLK